MTANRINGMLYAVLLSLSSSVLLNPLWLLCVPRYNIQQCIRFVLPFSILSSWSVHNFVLCVGRFNAHYSIFFIRSLVWYTQSKWEYHSYCIKIPRNKAINLGHDLAPVSFRWTLIFTVKGNSFLIKFFVYTKASYMGLTFIVRDQIPSLLAAEKRKINPLLRYLINTNNDVIFHETRSSRDQMGWILFHLHIVNCQMIINHVYGLRYKTGKKNIDRFSVQMKTKRMTKHK